MTLDDALLWLNDRIGKEVNVAVEIERGDFGFSVFQAGGELRYWNEAAKEDARPPQGVAASPQNAAIWTRRTAASSSAESGYVFTTRTTRRDASRAFQATATVPWTFPVWPHAGPHGVGKTAIPRP